MRRTKSRRLTFAELQERRKQLDEIGGSCDAPTWDQYNAWEARQSTRPRSK